MTDILRTPKSVDNEIGHPDRGKSSAHLELAVSILAWWSNSGSPKTVEAQHVKHGTNTWQSTIEAAGGSDMMPAHVLSGRTVIETHFYDGEMYLTSSRVRVFYDK